MDRNHEPGIDKPYRPSILDELPALYSNSELGLSESDHTEEIDEEAEQRPSILSRLYALGGYTEEEVAAATAVEETSQTAQVPKLTFEDLDYLWTNYGVGVSQIQSIPGYENFEVTDSEPLEVIDEIPERIDS